MTRNSGRGDRAAAVFGRMEPKPPAEAPADSSTSSTTTRSTPPPATDEKKQQIKYTVLLDVDDAVMWDELAVTLLRSMGKKIDKSSIVRTLVYLATEDEGIRRQLIETLKREGVKV